MLLADPDSRPRKPLFMLKTAGELIAGVKAELQAESTKTPAARAVMLAHMRAALAEARRGAEAELVATGKGTRCAMNLAAAQDEIIRAVHQFAVKDVYPVDNPSGAEAISSSAEVRAVWASFMQKWIDQTAALIVAERERGAAPDTIPAIDLATSLNQMNERTMMAALSAEQPAVHHDRVVDTLAHIWVTSIYGEQI